MRKYVKLRERELESDKEMMLMMMKYENEIF